MIQCLPNVIKYARDSTWVTAALVRPIHCIAAGTYGTYVELKVGRFYLYGWIWSIERKDRQWSWRVEKVYQYYFYWIVKKMKRLHFSWTWFENGLKSRLDCVVTVSVCCVSVRFLCVSVCWGPACPPTATRASGGRRRWRRRWSPSGARSLCTRTCTAGTSATTCWSWPCGTSPGCPTRTAPSWGRWEGETGAPMETRHTKAHTLLQR